MAGIRKSWLMGTLILFGVSLTAKAESKVFKQTTKGTPPIGSIDVLAFAPDGVLLIGDGKKAQVLAVDTKDTSPKGTFSGAIEGIDAKIAGRLGTKPNGIEIVDLAVNPASETAYIAVRKQDDKSYVIVTIDGSGKVAEFPLKDVSYARLELTSEQSPLRKVTDLAWAEDRVLASASANEEFGSKIFSAKAPLAHDSKADIYSAETYHVSHQQWETKAPMSAIIPYRENDKLYVVGAFACTPIVKYPIEAIQPGAKVKGLSVLELGSGNAPLDMFTYEKDGKNYVLANTHRFHHQKSPIGPSPYWTARFERDVLDEDEKVNEQALRRVGAKLKPATERVKYIDEFNGVQQMDKLDDGRAMVLRVDREGRVNLEILPLP